MRERKLIHPGFGALGLFCFLVGMGLFFFRGELVTSDELTMALTTQAIAERQSLFFEEPIYDRLYTNYGVGTPVAGLPAYFVEKVLRSVGIMDGSDFTLIPLTNGLLLGLMGVALGLMLEGQRRWWYLALAMLASPLFPASLTFYSEMLTATGMALLATCLYRGCDRQSEWMHRLVLAGVFAGALVAVAARVAVLPLVVIILFWGWRIGASRRSLMAGVFGLAGAGLVFLGQNWHLRGAPFAFPYETQDFTTPVLTGLYGLLVAPERGILVFFPAILVCLVAWRQLPGRGQAVLSLACALTMFSLVFHGRFWTWHGGWTTGPRFLLPCLMFFTVPVALLIERRRELDSGLRLALILSLAWSVLLVYIYARYSAFKWWNQLWGFHQLENQWLFLPQLSLWQTWFDGAPLPHAQPDFATTPRVVFTGLGVALLIVSMYPLLLPFRGYLGTEATEPLGVRFRRIDKMFVAAMLLIGVVFGVHELRGPRGWRVSESSMHAPGDTISHLIVEGDSGVFEGWVDNPLASTLKLNIKADSLYEVYVNEELLLEQKQVMAQHLNRLDVPVRPGLVQIRVHVWPKTPETRALFHLYWSWGGEGVYLAPAGGEYLLPRPLTPLESVFTKVWRRKFILGAGALALFVILRGLPRQRSEA